MYTRVIVIVLDSVGVGALPDACIYGDEHANTVGNIATTVKGLHLPNLGKLGFGNILSICGTDSVEFPQAHYGKMAELSHGKDTTTGHWELAGCPVFQPFPVYPEGFPDELIEAFVLHTGKEVLGNKPASGTEIIAELGDEHIRTGKLIVYTSADSVLQIAAHEEVVPLEELYHICQITREKVCIGPHSVGRIIARPFIGLPGNFTRTANRHDYSLAPMGKTVLDQLTEEKIPVVGIGKIADIYAHRGVAFSYPTTSNHNGIEILLRVLDEAGKFPRELIMANLVDFDMLYGHRNDIKGYGNALEEFDRRVPEILQKLGLNDLLVITADHGCDPTTFGTDHTREYVPLLVYDKQGNKGTNLGIRTSFADVAATIGEIFRLPSLSYGKSFLKEILAKG